MQKYATVVLVLGVCSQKVQHFHGSRLCLWTLENCVPLLSDQREINEGARSVNMLSLFFPQMKVNGFAVPGLACGVERKSHFSLA